VYAFVRLRAILAQRRGNGKTQLRRSRIVGAPSDSRMGIVLIVC
jgi:hypothetical protein